MRGRLVLLISLVGLAAAAATGAQPATGLRGTVFAQGGPVCVEDRACLSPARGVVLLFRRDGRTVARVTSRAGGTYVVRLARVRYSVAVASRPTARITPPTVRVTAGRVRRVDFELDSGLQ